MRAGVGLGVLGAAGAHEVGPLGQLWVLVEDVVLQVALAPAKGSVRERRLFL